MARLDCGSNVFYWESDPFTEGELSTGLTWNLDSCEWASNYLGQVVVHLLERKLLFCDFVGPLALEAGDVCEHSKEWLSDALDALDDLGLVMI